MKKGIILAILLFACQILPANAQISANHWAYNDATKAISQKWIEDTIGNFEPDKITTRAEFVCMLEKAIRLTPDSDTAKFYTQVYTPEIIVQPFNDTRTHWLETGGWLKTALDFGLVIPADYDNKLFKPDEAISRRESIVMVIRALGRVYPASQYEPGRPLFTDWDSIPNWAKGYTNEMVNFKLLLGFPEGNAQVDKPLTKAQAVAFLNRAMNEMTQGVDSAIKVTIDNVYPKENALYQKQQLTLPVPAQIVNQKIYVPIRALYDNGGKLYGPAYGTGKRYYWHAKAQILWFEYGVSHQFQPGNSYMGFHGNVLPFTGKLRDEGNLLASEVRMLYGELMVPVIDNGQSAQLRSTGMKTWDANTKTVLIPMMVPQAPTS